jgi:hypothetical protein
MKGGHSMSEEIENISETKEGTMEDLDRYNEMNKHISAVGTFFDVFLVIAKHGLLGELKSSSTSYLFTEMGERLEALKNLNKETYDRLQELRRLEGATS